VLSVHSLSWNLFLNTFQTSMLPFPSRSANSKLQKKLKHDDESHRHVNYTIKRCRINENASSSTQDESEIHTALETGGLIDLEINREERKRRRKKLAIDQIA